MNKDKIISDLLVKLEDLADFATHNHTKESMKKIMSDYNFLGKIMYELYQTSYDIRVKELKEVLDKKIYKWEQ